MAARQPECGICMNSIKNSKPTETEASSPVVEKGNEDPAEGTKIQDKAIATETTLLPPIVNEEVVVSPTVNIEKVDSSDVGITVENEKNEKLKLECKEDQWFQINHEGKKQYEGDFQLQLRKAPEPTLKPLDLPDIPDIIIKKSTETEASAPVVEKENEEPIESAIIKDKVIASEMTPPPPIVNEEVVDTVENNIENVDSSDVSVAVENEKNEKLKLKYKYKEDQWSPINHEGKKQYDRDFLLQLQNAPESTLKPLDLPDIPDIIIEKAPTRSANRDFAEGSSFVDFTPRYVWSGGPNRSGGVPRRACGQRGRGGPGGSATQGKHINLSIQNDIELHHAKEAWKPGHRVEKMDGEVDLKSETTTNYPQRMTSPVFQSSMPTAQQGLFQLLQENTGSFTPHAHTHTYNNPPAVFYNAAQKQNRHPSALGMSGPGQQAAKKRVRRCLPIIDPYSGKDITQEVQQARGTPPSSATLGPHSTVSGQETPHMPQNEIKAQFLAQVTQIALGTHPVGNQQRTQSDGTQYVAQVALGTHPDGNQQRPLSDEEQFADQEAVFTHQVVNQQRTLSDVTVPQFVEQVAQVAVFTHPVGNQQRTQSDVTVPQFVEQVAQVGLGTHPVGNQQRTQLDAAQFATQVSLSTHPGGNQQRTQSEEAQFADQAAQVTISTHPGGNQQRTLSEAKDVKKDERGKKKSKDINRKGETKQGSEMDAFMDLPSKTEASESEREKEKENEEPIESAIIKDKVIASEMTPPPPIVNEEVRDTVEINIENVDSSDVSVAIENEKNEKLKLKYKYKEDQWSPINHEGKKQYDRDFLLQLQNAPESTLKPLDLPDIPDIIIGKAPTRSANRDFAEGSSYVDLTPRYVWFGGPNRSGGVPRRASGQQGRGGPGGSATQAKHINLSIQKDIELYHAKEAWKPGHRVEKMDGEVDLKSEELFKKVQAILNKLTPQKFPTLVAKMQALEIDTEARLKSVIDLVFEKAISKPGFSGAIANMCRCLSMFKVPAESKQGDVNFRDLLLTRCQREFEKANSSEKEFDSTRKEIEKATAEEQKQQMKEELEAEETKAKRRSLGNISFIGELFKLKMLTENIMHDCVFKLLRTKDEENLECLCRLLKTIGKELDTDKAKPRMDQYFAQMQKIVNEKKLSSRVRFMLQDVIELRQDKWVFRWDAQDRAIFLQILQQTNPQKGSHGRPGQPSGLMGGGGDGWNTLYRTPLRTDRTIDPTKLKLSKVGDCKNIQLGPVGGAACLGWFKGSTGGGARFQEGERPNALGNRTIVAQRPSEERSSGREPERAKTMEKPSTPVQELTDDQILNKTRAIMDEYLHIQDIGEAISSVQELSASGCLHLFVYNALNQVLERSEVARRQTGLLLHDLVKNNILLVDTYVKGLNEILMFAEDMEIDIPKIWEYLGQLIGPMVQDGSVPLGFLKQVCEPLKANGKSGILVAEILHDASHREGHKKVGKLWAESRLHWSDFVPKNQIDQFLSEKKLEFTKGGNNAPTSPTASMAIPKIEERLNDLITNRGCSNEEVFDWIEEEVDELTVKQEYFIRALMTAVCKSAIIVSSNNLMKVDKSQIQRRNNLLQKYLDHQANFELQALFALQALVHKLEHPPGVFRELFDILYDEDIISEDAFIQWEKSEDPQEQEGKGVAMKQVVLFFTWLKEAEDDGES